jgi:hypothetical protein
MGEDRSRMPALYLIPALLHPDTRCAFSAFDICETCQCDSMKLRIGEDATITHKSRSLATISVGWSVR